ncbi:MAG: T9SS type A sorting domain-containing protein, partial [Flavobacterium sp.]
PTLAYICADESQLLSLVTAVGNENVSVNSYCSVEPGAPYNTITGTMRLDVDGNGCDGSDALARFVKLDVTGSDGQGSVYTNADGIYTIYTGAGDTSVSTSFENSNYFDLVLPFSHNFPLVDGSTFTQDICLSPSGPHPDLEVVIAPISPARPGFEAAYRIVYKNKGNQVMSSDTPAVFFNFDANHMTFLESDTAPEQVSAGSLGWSYADLQPFESRVITIAMQVNAPTNPTFPVNVGDHLAFNSQISPIATDDSPIDNNFDYNQTVVGSYDPNDMYCIEGDVVAPDQIGNYLHYVINFENTGTDIAENVVVTDEILASQYDINSLQVVNSSDDVDISVDGGKVTFFFHDIKLPIGGHGNILLKIKSNGALAEGDSVLNNANIFFDYNLPIATNNAETLFQLLGLPDQQIDNAITIFPNPSHGMVNIKAATNIQSVQVYDVQGRLLQTSLRNGNDVSVDISSQQTGVYFLKITSDKGIKTERILKN